MATSKPDSVYLFIVDFKKKHDGNSPTLREIAEGCNVSATSLVKYYLEFLVEAGLIEVTGDKSRMIMVTGGEWRMNNEHTDLS